MPNLEHHNLIAASPLFRHMLPQEAEAILARLRPVRFACGERILEQGVWHGRLYVVESGQVSVILNEHNDQQDNHDKPERTQPERDTSYVVATLGPGECFGEMSLLTGEPPNATVQANCDASLWSLTQADFVALMGTCPTLLHNINTVLSQRLTRVNQYLVAHQTAEIVLLTQMETPTAPVEHDLAYHIADALATCSQQRVLLLELAARDEAMGPRFAVHSEQIRPSLLACTRDHALLQEHRHPTRTTDGRYFPAVSTLAETHDERASLDSSVLLTLGNLAPLYDYILLTSYQKISAPTPEMLSTLHQLSVSQGIKQHLILFPADATTHSGLLTTSSLPNDKSSVSALFVTHVQESPTIGIMEQYAERIGLPVLRLLPADDALLKQSWQQRQALQQLAPATPLSKAVHFVARHIAHQTVGMAFGGGAARGFAHVGVLAGLLERGVPLDYISACSIGTLAPGMHLMGKSLAEIEQAFLQIQQNIVQWRIPRTSVFSNRGIRTMLHSFCGDVCFEDLETPFAIVAADLTTRAGVVLDRGPLWQAGLASVSLPGIFPPVVIGEHVLVDAGIHDPVPIRLVRQMGADILLASELGEQEPPALVSATSWQLASQQKTRSPHIVDVLLRSYDLAMATIGMHSIREADVVIRPELHRVSLRQFSEGRKFIRAGREAVEKMLPALRQHLPWL
jgi:NTE family protein